MSPSSPSTTLLTLAVGALVLVSCHSLEGPARIESELAGAQEIDWMHSERELTVQDPLGLLDVGPEAFVEPPPTQPEPLVPVVLPQVFTDPTPRSLEFRAAPLSHAWRVLGETGGVNLVLKGAFDELVDISLPTTTLQSALEALARTFDCHVEIQGDLVVVTRDDPFSVRTEVLRLSSIPAAIVAPQLTELLGAESIIVNPERNVILVRGTAPQLAEVRAFVATVDRPDRQVHIEARILEISREDLEDLGIAINAQDISVDTNTATFVTSLLDPQSPVVASFTNHDSTLDYTLTALTRLVDLTVISRPRLIALNNTEAKLEIISEIPYVNATTSTEASGTSVSAQTIEEVEFKDVGLELTVTPTIQDHGLISLNVMQRISEQTGVFNEIPVVDSRNITTSFVVREGQTIAIGGITKNRRLETATGVPILMDLPLVGHFFRRDEDERRAMELVILMTPRLVDPLTAARLRRISDGR